MVLRVTLGGRTGEIRGMNRLQRWTDDIRGDGHITLGGRTDDIMGDGYMTLRGRDR